MEQESVKGAMSEFTSNIESPLQVESADMVEWDHEADLIVVGFGGAGVCAALEAREQGATVIALDRFGGGGATANSGGVVYAGGTDIQAQAGFADSAENMYNYLNFEGTPVSEETLRAFCNSSADNIRWLQSKGVVFESTVYDRSHGLSPRRLPPLLHGHGKVSSGSGRSGTPRPSHAR